MGNVDVNIEMVQEKALLRVLNSILISVPESILCSCLNELLCPRVCLFVMSMGISDGILISVQEVCK